MLSCSGNSDQTEEFTLSWEPLEPPIIYHPQPFQLAAFRRTAAGATSEAKAAINPQGFDFSSFAALVSASAQMQEACILE